MSSSLNNAHALLVSVARLGRGMRARTQPASQPRERLELYEFESCPYCRKVREVLSELDVEYVSRPCAKGSRNRAALKARGGKVQVPYLVDPNTKRELYESEEIITYLTEAYGQGRAPLARVFAPLNTFGAGLSSALRPRGGKVRPAATTRAAPAQTLELWNFEASPYCRKVRETLCSLDLDSVVHNVAKKSTRRPELVALGGKMRVPYLVDPNTGTAMYESDDIVAYLDRTYGA